MFEFHGVWLPDGEKHLPGWMSAKGIPVRNGFPTYQYHKYKVARRLTKNRRRAVDVGAFVGQWSRVMAMDFESVTAFEPVGAYRDCWYRNMQDVDNADLFPVALGAASGTVEMVNITEGSFGDTRIRQGQAGTVVDVAAMTTLDTHSREWNALDLLKIDCEGFELMVLEGAERTLEVFHPVVIVEQKHGGGAVSFLEKRGWKSRYNLAGDFILSWDDGLR